MPSLPHRRAVRAAFALGVVLHAWAAASAPAVAAAPAAAAAAAPAEVAPASAVLTVATFNIRFGSANDGPDAWPLRRDKVIATIADLSPDVLGLQEVEAFQAHELLTALPRYACLGAHRDDGRTAGEGAPIFFDRTRFTAAESGTFWLSGTPDAIASVTWDNAITRIAVWARLVDLATGRGVYVLNAHFDHVGQASREQAARLLRARIAELTTRPGRADPVVVLGDFNADESNPAFAAMLAPDPHQPHDPAPPAAPAPPGPPGPTLTDPYRALHPDGPAHTFTGFRLDRPPVSGKIDHVFVSADLRPLAAGIDTRTIEGRYPSDHFPVWARLALD